VARKNYKLPNFCHNIVQIVTDIQKLFHL